ncbi:MAG TPA: hypothetical protein VFI73_00970 [Candidatus Nitrosopolaris sp.]|nr:hypothetical protein [Candidatus Nitrosopolaris sp.]
MVSPYTLGIVISVIDKFQHIREEAKIVVGNPVLISNKPSGSAELANLVCMQIGRLEKDEPNIERAIAEEIQNYREKRLLNCK